MGGQVWVVGRFRLMGAQNSLPIMSEVVGRAEFNVATLTYATVAYGIREFINKTNLELLQEGFKIEPQRILG